MAGLFQKLTIGSIERADSNDLQTAFIRDRNAPDNKWSDGDIKEVKIKYSSPYNLPRRHREGVEV
jgi:hypothetical protein